MFNNFSKAICTHAHAHAHEPGYPHARTHAQACIHTHQYVILIAFPWQQWFRERASVLRNTYIACLVYKRNGAFTAPINCIFKYNPGYFLPSVYGSKIPLGNKCQKALKLPPGHFCLCRTEKTKTPAWAGNCYVTTRCYQRQYPCTVLHGVC